MLLAIENDPRDYAWGRRGAISALLGRPATDAVEAELWFGAHEGSPPRVVTPAETCGATDLTAAVETVPELTGGAGRIPFLLKIITPGSALSLQAHPTAAQAAAGFAREEAAGIPIGAFARNFKDPYSKPELIVAIDDGFRALAGLRPVQDAVAALHHLAAVDAITDEQADTMLELAGELDESLDLGVVIARLLARGQDAVDQIAAVSAAVLADPVSFPVQADLVEAHPADPGIVISLLLHQVTLRRGEALYLPAGNLHAYLDGVGIELMTASDNVLRGGLTAKHVDVPELLAVLDSSPRDEPRLPAMALPGGGVEYRPDDPDAGFGLAWIDGETTLPLTGPAIALCLDGDFEVTGERSSAAITRGGALLASPDERTLRISGAGLLVVAR